MGATGQASVPSLTVRSPAVLRPAGLCSLQERGWGGCWAAKPGLGQD